MEVLDAFTDAAGETTVFLSGEADSIDPEPLCAQIVAAAGDTTKAVTVDLGHITFFDSTAIRMLIRVRQQLDQRGIRLYVGPCSGTTRRVLEVTGVFEHLARPDDLDEQHSGSRL